MLIEPDPTVTDLADIEHDEGNPADVFRLTRAEIHAIQRRAAAEGVRAATDMIDVEVDRVLIRWAAAVLGVSGFGRIEQHDDEKPLATIMRYPETENEYRHEADPYDHTARRVAGLRVILSRLRGVRSLDEVSELADVVAHEIRIAEEAARALHDGPWLPLDEEEAAALVEAAAAALCEAAADGPPTLWQKLARGGSKYAVSEWSIRARMALRRGRWRFRPDGPWVALGSGSALDRAGSLLRCCAAYGLLPEPRLDMGAAGVMAALHGSFPLDPRGWAEGYGLGAHAARWMRDARVVLGADAPNHAEAW